MSAVGAMATALDRVALPPVQARAATTTNVNLASTLPTIDGVLLNGNGSDSSDIVLVKDQTTASQNGLYWANSGGPMVRANVPLVPSRSIQISEGITNAHSDWALAAKGPILVGTRIAFVRLLPWANVRAFGAIGDGSNDDTSAIAAAIAATAVARDTTLSVVYFPPGVYKVTAPLLISYAAGVYGIVLLGANRAADLVGGIPSQSIIRAAFVPVSGTAASVTDVSRTRVTIGGLSALGSVVRGDTIQLTGAASASNNNEFTIISVNVRDNSLSHRIPLITFFLVLRPTPTTDALRGQSGSPYSSVILEVSRSKTWRSMARTPRRSASTGRRTRTPRRSPTFR